MEESLDEADIVIAPGTVIDGRYRVVREIAASASSRVLDAEHLVTSRRVAIKQAMTGERRALLGVEARVLGRIDHPNVVQVLDARVDTEAAFVTLELLQGRSLHGIVCAGRPIPVATVATIARDLASALVATHATGTLHGSVSTKNVFIARQHGREVVKLVDFERACAPGSVAAATESTVTPEARVAGRVDERSDLYALGLLIRDCLALAPSGADALAGLVRDLLRDAPEERPRSARAVLEALTSVASTAPLQLLSPPLPKASGGAELRTAPRANYVSPVRVFVGTVVRDGRSEDVSAGGMLLVMRDALVQGSEVRLRLGLPIEGTVIETRAQVAWVRAHAGGAYAVGTSFVDPPPVLVQSIARYVEFAGR